MNRIEKLISEYEESIVELTSLYTKLSETINNNEFINNTEFRQRKNKTSEIIQFQSNTRAAIIYLFSDEIFNTFGKISLVDLHPTNCTPGDVDFVGDIIPFVRKIIQREKLDEELPINKVEEKKKPTKI